MMELKVFGALHLNYPTSAIILLFAFRLSDNGARNSEQVYFRCHRNWLGTYRFAYAFNYAFLCMCTLTICQASPTGRKTSIGQNNLLQYGMQCTDSESILLR